MAPSERREPKQKILFICGSLNQTKQMHQIAMELAEHECWYTPWYVDPGHQMWAKNRGFLEMSIAGDKLRARCIDYLEHHQLRIDRDGREVGNDYDLVLTCTDQLVQKNIRDKKVVMVQEGILDPRGLLFQLYRIAPWLVPRYIAGTAATGLSNLYHTACVASEGYKQYMMRYGIPEEKLIVTGIPNFDNCDRYYDNDFPHEGYVLVTTSDARETGKWDNRKKFIQGVVDIAKGRQIIFKLHPNEKVDRAVREIKKWAPGALVYPDGSAEEMVANCEVLICQYSSLVYIGLALGKEVHSYFDMKELESLLPVQNHRAAENIAAVCRNILAEEDRGRPVELFPAPEEQRPAREKVPSRA